MEMPRFVKECPECHKKTALVHLDPYDTDDLTGDMTFNCPTNDCLGQMVLTKKEVEETQEKIRKEMMEEHNKASAQAFKVEDQMRMGKVFHTVGLVYSFIKLEMDHPERQSNINFVTDLEGNVDFMYTYENMTIRLPLDPEYFIFT